MTKKFNFILTILIGYILINMVLFPKLYLTQTLNGISAWAFNVLPSVLPFIFFTKILSAYSNIQKSTSFLGRPMKLLYNTPALSGYVFFMSIISGYPVGAKMTSDLYLSGKITRQDALKMTSFCSTSGPMFIIGAVGVGLIKGAIYGYIILIAHIFGALLNGLLYRKIKVKKKKKQHFNIESKPSDLSSIVIDSAISIISVGTIIAIFFVVIQSLNPLLSLLPSPVAAFIAGLVEITKGCIDLASSLSPNLATITCTFIISFGGLSTMLQSLTMLDKIKMPIWLFALQKFTHAILATIISIILILLF